MVPAPEQEADAEKGRAVSGDERVSEFRDGRETGQVSVESKPESLAACVAQGQETGLGGAGNMSIGGNAGSCADSIKTSALEYAPIELV